MKEILSQKDIAAYLGKRYIRNYTLTANGKGQECIVVYLELMDPIVILVNVNTGEVEFSAYYVEDLEKELNDNYVGLEE